MKMDFLYFQYFPNCKRRERRALLEECHTTASWPTGTTEIMSMVEKERSISALAFSLLVLPSCKALVHVLKSNSPTGTPGHYTATISGICSRTGGDSVCRLFMYLDDQQVEESFFLSGYQNNVDAYDYDQGSRTMVSHKTSKQNQ